jgi:hypothetical protein
MQRYYPAIICALLSIACLWAGILATYHMALPLLMGVETTGRVVDMNVTHGKHNSVSYHVIVEFHDAAGTIHCVQDFMNGEKEDLHTDVVVHYLRDDPQRASIGGVVRNIIATIVFGGFGFLMGYACIKVMKKIRSHA